MDTFKTELKNIFPSLPIEERNSKEVYTLLDEEKVLPVMHSLKGKGFSLVSLFAAEDFSGVKGITLLYVFEKEKYEEVLIVQTKTVHQPVSLGALFPVACFYEREIHDGFGVTFKGAYDTRGLFLHERYPQHFHPLLKSFKNMHIKTKKTILQSEEYPFKKVEGEGIYHIPVGPVHAGIIAPGHFRFSAIGETIFNLEIRHFWKHRGIEKLAEDKTPEEALLFAEAICGDETVAHAFAYCQAIEKICKIKVPSRAEYLRVLFAEMERIYSLLGDLAGMIVDVAYPAGASPFFVLREEILRWNALFSGSRFYKKTLAIGGLVKDVPSSLLQDLMRSLGQFHSRFTQQVNLVLASPLVMDRFETTGIVKKELVSPLHLTGPLARASGVNTDVRQDHPYGIYSLFPPSNKVLETGDVLARFRVKAATIRDSLRMISHFLKAMPRGSIIVDYHLKDGHAFSLVESPRGQHLQFVVIKNGSIDRFKVRSASFCNWYALEQAVLGNIVPDFPLINKSMNLSYEGNDL